MGASIKGGGGGGSTLVHDHSGAGAGGTLLLPQRAQIYGLANEVQLDVKPFAGQAASAFRVLQAADGVRMFQVDASGTVTVSDTTHTDSAVRFQVLVPSTQAANILQVIRAFAGGDFTAWSVGSTGVNVFGDTTVHGKSVVRLQINQGSTQDVDMVRVRNTAGTVDFVKVDSAGVFSLSAPLAVGSGGTGIAALASGNLPLGAGASAFTALAPGAAGGFVRSDGAAWARATIVDADLPATLTANARIAVSKNSGATVGTRRRINLIEGTNVTMTIADDAGSEEVDVTINSSGGAVGPHNLLSATHTDTLAHTPPARGSLIVGHSSGTAWDELLVGTGFLRATGVASDPAWAAVDLATSDVTGTLAATKGGTGLAAYTTGDMIYSSATNTLSRLTAVAVGKVLISAGVATAPAWGTAPAIGGGTGIATYVTGDVIYASATNVLSKLAINATPTRYLSSDPGGATAVSWQPVNLGNGVTGTLPVTSGGTGLTTFSQGDLIYSAAPSSLTALAKNTSATRYLSNTGTSNDPAWAQVNLANGVTGTLPAANIGAHDHSSGGQGGSSLFPLLVQVGNASTSGTLTIFSKDPDTYTTLEFANDRTGQLGSLRYPGGGVDPVWYLPSVSGVLQVQTYAVPTSAGDPPAAGEMGVVNRSGLSADVTPAVILTNATVAGFYSIFAYLSNTVARSLTSAPSLRCNYTDDAGAKNDQLIVTMVPTATTVAASAVKIVYLASGNITWNVTGYVATDALRYGVKIRVTYLGP